MLMNSIYKIDLKIREKDLQKFHIFKANENIRSKVRSNFVIPNIPVERMRNDMWYSYIYKSDAESRVCEDV